MPTSMANYQAMHQSNKEFSDHETASLNRALLRDLINIVQNMKAGLVTVSYRASQDSSRRLWALQGPQKNPVVILYYKNEPNANADCVIGANDHTDAAGVTHIKVESVEAFSIDCQTETIDCDFSSKTPTGEKTSVKPLLNSGPGSQLDHASLSTSNEGSATNDEVEYVGMVARDNSSGASFKQLPTTSKITDPRCSNLHNADYREIFFNSADEEFVVDQENYDSTNQSDTAIKAVKIEPDFDGVGQFQAHQITSPSPAFLVPVQVVRSDEKCRPNNSTETQLVKKKISSINLVNQIGKFCALVKKSVSSDVTNVVKCKSVCEVRNTQATDVINPRPSSSVQTGNYKELYFNTADETFFVDRDDNALLTCDNQSTSSEKKKLSLPAVKESSKKNVSKSCAVSSINEQMNANPNHKTKTIPDDSKSEVQKMSSEKKLSLPPVEESVKQNVSKVDAIYASSINEQTTTSRPTNNPNKNMKKIKCEPHAEGLAQLNVSKQDVVPGRQNICSSVLVNLGGESTSSSNEQTATRGDRKRGFGSLTKECYVRLERLEYSILRSYRMDEKSYHVENLCEKPCATSSSLKQHEPTPVGEKSYPISQSKKGLSTVRRVTVLDHDCTETNAYTCSNCKKKFSSIASLKKHVLVHIKERAHVCAYCDKKFILLKNLQMHQCSKKREIPYQCSYCGIKFFTFSRLKVHQQTHAAVRVNQCNVCQKEFTTRFGLVVHQRIHSGEQPFSCMRCGTRFTARKNMKRHERKCLKSTALQQSTDLQLAARQSTDLQCYCEKKFSTSGGLRIHERRHTGEKPYDCSFCEKKFVTSCKLKAHLQLHTYHIKCSHCEKEFLSKSGWKKHERLHLKGLPFQCSICELSFCSSYRLKIHKQYHAETEKQQYQCSRCDKIFGTFKYLKAHACSKNSVVQEKLLKCCYCSKKFPLAELKQHEESHKEEDLKQCFHCERKFANLEDLKTHEKVHTGKRPHQCSICKKRFSNERYLRKHQQLHIEGRNFQCPHCPKSFLWAAELKKHEWRVHVS